MGVLNDPELEQLLATLHARSDAQVEAISRYHAQPPAENEAALLKDFRADKLVALDRDKAEFCYLLCRANNARRIVEAGTSYGVSTLYLAAAVRDNAAVAGGKGVVIGTEYEPEKARAARAHFAQAGLSDYIDLREGDSARDTEGRSNAHGGFHAGGHLDRRWRGRRWNWWRHVCSPGAIVICDNTRATLRTNTARLISRFLSDPANGFRTMTLPFDGGLELSVRCRA